MCVMKVLYTWSWKGSISCVQESDNPTVGSKDSKTKSTTEVADVAIAKLKT